MSMFPTRSGKKTNAKHERTMIGKAIYSPISNASDLFSALPPPGTTPPNVAALISSSDASHDFIFSSRLKVVVEEDDSSLPSASAMKRAGER